MKNKFKKISSTLMVGIGFANMCLPLNTYAMLLGREDKNFVGDNQKDKNYCEYKEFRALLKLGRVRDFEEKLSETSIEELKNKNGETLLHEAARYNQVKIFELLLNNGLDVNVKDNEGNTPMHVAAQNDSEEISEIIISLDPGSIYDINDNNESPILLAVKSNAKRVSTFLIRNGLDFNNYFIGKFNLIQTAAHENAFGVLSECVKFGKADLSKQDEHSNTLLHIAAESDSMEVVNFLIKNGANVNAKNDLGATPLHKAAQANSKRICELLMDKKLGKNKADIDEKDLEGRTPLHYAAMSDSSVSAKYLISRKANSRIKDINGYIPFFLAAISKAGRAYCVFKEGLSNERDANGQTAMHHAILTRDIQLANFLLDKGFDINSKNSTGLNSLQLANNEKLKRREDRVEEVAVSKFTDEFICLLGTKGIDCRKINNFDKKALHNAVAENSIEKIKSLISKGVDINSRDENKNTPLHLAVELGLNEIARLLISKGADVNAINGENKTPLYKAVFNDSISNVKLLISQKNIDVNIKDENGFTPLSVAVAKGNKEIVSLLVSRGADINFDDKYGLPLLFLTVFNDSTDILEYLLSSGADPNQRMKVLNYINEEERFRAKKVIKCGNTDLCKKPLITFLITEKSETIPDGMNTQVETLKIEGIKDGLSVDRIVDIVKILLDHGADPDALYLFTSPLSYSISFGLLPVSELLILRGANVNSLKSEVPCKSPLHAAAYFNYENIAKLLIAKGADINSISDGQPVLMEAVDNNSIECVKLLILNGADVNAAANTGCTSLHVAVELGEEECVNLLIDAGANVNSKSMFGVTPLMLAMNLKVGVNPDYLKYKLRTIKKLLSVYGDGNNSDNSILLHIAIDNNLPIDIICALIQKGVDLNNKSLYDGKTALALVLERFPERKDVCDIIKAAGGQL